MALHTRRTVLTAGAIGLSTLAGCSSLEDDSTDEQPTDETDETDGRDRITDLDVEYLWFDTTDSVLEHETDGNSILLTEPGDLEALELHATPIEPDTDEPLAFLRAIEYDESSAILLEEQIMSCYQLAVQYVERRENRRHRVQLCETRHDPGFSCSVDDQYVQITMIELPVVTDEQSTRVSYGVRSNCRLPSEEEPNTETDTGGDAE